LVAAFSADGSVRLLFWRVEKLDVFQEQPEDHIYAGSWVAVVWFRQFIDGFLGGSSRNGAFGGKFIAALSTRGNIFCRFLDFVPLILGGLDSLFRTLTVSITILLRGFGPCVMLGHLPLEGGQMRSLRDKNCRR